MYCIEHHGTSGRWYPYANVEDLAEATAIGQRLKNDGYGVRIWEATSLVANAPWDEDFCLQPTRAVRDWGSVAKRPVEMGRAIGK